MLFDFCADDGDGCVDSFVDFSVIKLLLTSFISLTEVGSAAADDAVHSCISLSILSQKNPPH